MQALVYKTSKEELRKELDLARQELLSTVEQMQEINKERHTYEDLYNEQASAN